MKVKFWEKEEDPNRVSVQRAPSVAVNPDVQAFLSDYKAAYGGISPAQAENAAGTPAFNLWMMARAGGFIAAGNPPFVTRTEVLSRARAMVAALEQAEQEGEPKLGLQDAYSAVAAGKLPFEEAARQAGMHPNAFNAALQLVFAAEDAAFARGLAEGKAATKQVKLEPKKEAAPAIDPLDMAPE